MTRARRPTRRGIHYGRSERPVEFRCGGCGYWLGYIHRDPSGRWLVSRSHGADLVPDFANPPDRVGFRCDRCGPSSVPWSTVIRALAMYRVEWRHQRVPVTPGS